jgi:hypothetical protein
LTLEFEHRGLDEGLAQSHAFPVEKKAFPEEGSTIEDEVGGAHETGHILLSHVLGNDFNLEAGIEIEQAPPTGLDP